MLGLLTKYKRVQELLAAEKAKATALQEEVRQLQEKLKGNQEPKAGLGKRPASGWDISSFTLPQATREGPSDWEAKVAQLQHRVAQLEEENKALREGRSLAGGEPSLKRSRLDAGSEQLGSGEAECTAAAAAAATAATFSDFQARKILEDGDGARVGPFAPPLGRLCLGAGRFGALGQNPLDHDNAGDGMLEDAMAC